jgi:hypothetical protein
MIDERPTDSLVIRISSPLFNVNESGGTMPAPVIRKQPRGKLFSRNNLSACDGSGRLTRPTTYPHIRISGISPFRRTVTPFGVLNSLANIERPEPVGLACSTNARCAAHQSDVARRRADEAIYGNRLHVFAKENPHYRPYASYPKRSLLNWDQSNRRGNAQWRECRAASLAVERHHGKKRPECEPIRLRSHHGRLVEGKLVGTNRDVRSEPSSTSPRDSRRQARLVNMFTVAWLGGRCEFESTGVDLFRPTRRKP